MVQYVRDLAVARSLDRFFPGSRLAGQGSALWPVLGEPLAAFFGYLPRYLERAGELVDIVNWHYYPQQSHRSPAASRRAFPSFLLDRHKLDEAAYRGEKVTGATVTPRLAASQGCPTVTSAGCGGWINWACCRSAVLSWCFHRGEGDFHPQRRGHSVLLPKPTWPGPHQGAFSTAGRYTVYPTKMWTLADPIRPSLSVARRVMR